MTTVILAIKKHHLKSSQKKTAALKHASSREKKKYVWKKFAAQKSHFCVMIIYQRDTRKEGKKQERERKKRKRRINTNENLVLHDMKHAVECHLTAHYCLLTNDWIKFSSVAHLISLLAEKKRKIVREEEEETKFEQIKKF